MGYLSGSLRDMGFVPTGEQSPIDERGELWKKGVEVVCDETGTVIDGNHNTDDTDDTRQIYRYRNSGRVKLVGGYVGSYDWGRDGSKFKY